MNRKQRRKMRRIAGKIRGWILTAMAIMAAIPGIVRSRDHGDARMGTGLVSGAGLHGCDRWGVADNVHGRKRSF